MLRLIVCIIILAAVCCAQNFFTCPINNDVWSPQRPKEQVGSRGNLGQKKEPGIPDYQINFFRDQFNSLSQQLEDLKNQSRKTLQLIAAGSKMLSVPPHVYIYQLTPGRQPWQQSREYCQRWGGDLAVHGVKTLENRKKLIHNLSINKDYIWIGANDVASEGNWVWVNGKPATSSELIWDRGEPHNGGGEDYLLMVANPSRSNVGLGHDGLKPHLAHGVCEKAI